MTEKVQIGLRVTAELREELIKEAEKQQRSVNNLIEYILTTYINERKTNE